MLRRIFSTAMLSLFSAAFVIGCHASADVGDDTASGHTSVKKETVYRSDGDKTVKYQETHTSP